MRLIEIAGFVDGVENRNALSQEIRRMSGTFDLPDRAVGQTGRGEKGVEQIAKPALAHPRNRSTVASRVMIPFCASLATNVSAFSKSGYSHAEPFSQKSGSSRRAT